MDGKAIVMKKENLRRLFCAEHIIIFFCFLLAVFVRFYRLSEVPYGLHIDEIDGELCLRLDKAKGTTYLSMFDMFHAWQEQAEKLKSGEITQEEYDQWRYNYPKNAK